MAKITIRVNGRTREVESDDPDVPLLYLLRNDLGLTGTHFGCGLAQCGACTVLVGGRAIRSCITPAPSVGNRNVITIEGLGSPEQPDPLQPPSSRSRPRSAATARPGSWSPPARSSATRPVPASSRCARRSPATSAAAAATRA